MVFNNWYVRNMYASTLQFCCSSAWNVIRVVVVIALFKMVVSVACHCQSLLDSYLSLHLGAPWCLPHMFIPRISFPLEISIWFMLHLLYQGTLLNYPRQILHTLCENFKRITLKWFFILMYLFQTLLWCASCISFICVSVCIVPCFLDSYWLLCQRTVGMNWHNFLVHSVKE